ncbi:uncharacterized protein [Phyllobates terribilis]|uniref:uncharacterized protein n=1 Tax=Phyllobates terribilis TaxID=111132 RepID=UPI003CCB26B6
MGDYKMEQSILELRETFRSGSTRSMKWRITQLNSLLKMMTENEAKCAQALYQDLGKSYLEAYKDEIGLVVKSIHYALSNLKSWMSSKKVSLPLIFIPSRGEIMAEPYGLVLVISAWNFPINVALEPMIGAIAAGNAIVLKPSELAPASASFLTETIPLYMDNKAIKVIQGGPDVSQSLLTHKWDKIFYTGGQRVGQIVMAEAAKHLTPVTLELGGKCPTIFDFNSVSSNLEVAVMRIVAAKWGVCSGQACIAIDYLLVEEKSASLLIDMLKKMLKRFYGNDMTKLSRIINKYHYDRLCSLLDELGVKDSIVHGGSLYDEKLQIEPTLLLDPPLDSAVMKEEIFGPILPIITLKNIHESIDFINSKSKPLAIYAFTNDESLRKRVLAETSSGSVTFNDAVIHFISDTLPFGGVGASGMGSYHGKGSFDTFSHEKAVLKRGFFPEISARYPPWNDFKMEFVRLTYSFNYLGLLLLLLGIQKPPRTYRGN